MAELGFTFDPSTVEAGSSFDPLPSGKYLAQIIETAMKTPRNGGELMFSLTLEILSEPYIGRRLWDNLVVNHANQKPREMAQQKLKALCEACGVGPTNTTDVFEFIPFVVDVQCKRDRDSGEWKNEIKTFLPEEGAKPDTAKRASAPAHTAAPAAATRPPAARPGGGAAAPWSRTAAR